MRGSQELNPFEEGSRSSSAKPLHTISPGPSESSIPIPVTVFSRLDSPFPSALDSDEDEEMLDMALLDTLAASGTPSAENNATYSRGEDMEPRRGRFSEPLPALSNAEMSEDSALSN